MVMFTFTIFIAAVPDRDEQGQVVEDEFSSLPWYTQYFSRLRSRFFKTKRDLEEPFSDKLLPDPLPEPYHQPKYTVLVELNGLLVNSDWTHKHGWRFQKRPGVDMFLSQVGYPHFELVVYTVERGATFFPIVDGLDPQNQFIMWRLFRDATRYVNGHHTKDLKALNRDLRKVIAVDWDERSVALDKENALLLKKWEGDNSDRSLIGLAQLLQGTRHLHPFILAHWHGLLQLSSSLTWRTCGKCWNTTASSMIPSRPLERTNGNCRWKWRPRRRGGSRPRLSGKAPSSPASPDFAGRRREIASFETRRKQRPCHVL